MRYRPSIPLSRIHDFGLLRRFTKKVNVDKETGCWLWTGSRDKRGGYPRLWWRGKNLRAHRLSFSMFLGPIPAGMTVDHLCDCTRCVNPEHFDLKTVEDNVKERYARRRD